MNRAVIYARYSSSSQTEQSIEGQIRVCEEYAKTKDLIIVGAYIDRALTGKTDNRPEFQRLMTDCNKRIFDAVIVYRTDRFARNKYDSAIYKRHLKKAGIKLHYAAEVIPEGPEGIILESLMEGLAEYYSAELSQKIKRGIRESALKARSTGGNIALGYKIEPDKSFAVEEREAQAIKIIFDMFITGNSNAEICKHLNALGLKTRQGKPFNKNSIPRIIKNEKYIGVYKCNDIRIEDAVPEIIAKETFYAAQAELNNRRVSKQARPNVAEYLLSGKVFCGHCKRKMVGVSGTGKKNGKFYYYYCPSSRAKTGCDKQPVSKNYLENQIVSETMKHILSPDAIKYVAAKCYEVQFKSDARNTEINFFKNKLTENKKALSNTLKAIESGVETTTLPKRLKELETERTRLAAELKSAEEERKTFDPNYIEFMLVQYRKYMDDNEILKREIINKFVSAVYLYDNNLMIYYSMGKDKSELPQSVLADIEMSFGLDQKDNPSTICPIGELEEISSSSMGTFICPS